jgi:hypothetical protein
MGTIKVQALPDKEIVARYLAGEARGLLGLRAKIPDYRVVEILTGNGITLRSPAEARVITSKLRQEHQRRRGRC